uniref:4-hydroxyphenylpyruvate dioxygenase n=1 Tax=Leptobrachium leishanense TaxID=445787 RepID=A0A8C5QKD9_9ANUR
MGRVSVRGPGGSVGGVHGKSEDLTKKKKNTLTCCRIPPLRCNLQTQTSALRGGRAEVFAGDWWMRDTSGLFPLPDATATSAPSLETTHPRATGAIATMLRTLVHTKTSPHVLRWYERFGFKHFPLSKTEDQERGFEIRGPQIGLRLTAADSPALGKMVLAESLPQEDNQLDRFLQYHNKQGGIQHVGLFTPDIFKAAESMVQQGARFTNQPPTYYSDPRKQQEIRGLGPEIVYQIHNRYLLQVFLIERQDAEGFGEGNIRALNRSQEAI